MPGRSDILVFDHDSKKFKQIQTFWQLSATFISDSNILYYTVYSHTLYMLVTGSDVLTMGDSINIYTNTHTVERLPYCSSKGYSKSVIWTMYNHVV